MDAESIGLSSPGTEAESFDNRDVRPIPGMTRPTRMV